MITNGFDALEFFITNDESIQRLEEVENFFRGEPQGIMMEEQGGVIPFGHGYGRSNQDYQVQNNNNKKKKNNDEDVDVDAITSSYMAGDGQMRPATLVPESNGGIMMTEDTGIGIIGIDENARTSKKVMYYNYDGTLSKIKRNLYDNPVECYTD